MKLQSLTTTSYWERLGRSRKSYPSNNSRADRELMGILDEWLKPKSGDRLLEVGCGNSYMLPYFAKQYGFQVSGIDYSEKRISQAKFNLDEIGVRGTFLCCDVIDIWENWLARFDVAYSAGFYEHFSDPADVISLSTQYVREGGLVITTVPHLRSVWGTIDWHLNKRAGVSYMRMDLEQLVNAHKMAGLTVLSARYFRWLDPGVVNYAALPRVLQMGLCGTTWTLNALLQRVISATNENLPEALYSDMFVAARR